MLQSLSDAVTGLTERVSRSVVGVATPRSRGTGVVWTADGHVLTAAHVIGRAQSAHITTEDGEERVAKVVGSDPDNDIALLKVEGGGLVPLPVAEGELRSGQMVFALANPAGQRPSVTSGIVTTPRRSIRGWWGSMIEDAVITDAQLNPGYSGGPLVDVSGRLVGMNVAFFASRGVAVSAATLTDSLTRLQRDGRIRRGYLGIAVESIELPEELASRPDVDQERALLVRFVEPDTPAKAAGLALGDLLLRVGDEKVTDDGALHSVLTDQSIGKTVSLWVLRGEKLTELQIIPKEAEQ